MVAIAISGVLRLAVLDSAVLIPERVIAAWVAAGYGAAVSWSIACERIAQTVGMLRVISHFIVAAECFAAGATLDGWDELHDHGCSAFGSVTPNFFNSRRMIRSVESITMRAVVGSTRKLWT